MSSPQKATTATGTNVSDPTACWPPNVSNFGTFVLPPGTETISGVLVAAETAGFSGDMNFIVEPKPATIPEPVSWLLVSSALLGFWVVRRRNRNA